MPSLKKLPVGIQAFETIREDGYLYVDKTQHAFRMILQNTWKTKNLKTFSTP